METSSSESGQNSRPYARIPGSAEGRRAKQDFTCEHCGRSFTAKPVHDRRGVSPRRFCSKRCAGANRTAAAAAASMARESKPRQTRETSVPQHPAELMQMALVQPLTPGQSAKVRSYIFGLLRAQIPLAHRVVMGEVGVVADAGPRLRSAARQVRARPVGELSGQEKDDRDPTTLSRRELEELASRDEMGGGRSG